MSMDDIRTRLAPHKTTIITSALTAAGVFVVLGGIGALLIFSNQGPIYQYFANEFAQEFSTSATSSDTAPPLTTQESLVVGVVERTMPAVFSIIAEKEVTVGGSDPFDEFFRRFFGEAPPNAREPQRERRQVGGGSGFHIGNGLAVTNRHVVDDEAAEYTAVTQDGSEHDLEVIAKDPVLDIAVVRIEDADNLPALSFGNSDQLKVGQTVIAIGNALAEFQNSVSAGIVSGLERSIIAGSLFGQSEVLDEVIQTDAAINPGNSGGPLLNLRGDVIGVNVAVAQGSENIGFALPANVVKPVVDSVRETGRIIRPLLGVRFIMITPAFAESRDLPVARGALIASDPGVPAVVPDSAADKAGLREGDIILAVDGTELDRNNPLTSVIRKKRVGQEVELTILRGDEEFTATATLTEVPDDVE